MAKRKSKYDADVTEKDIPDLRNAVDSKIDSMDAHELDTLNLFLEVFYRNENFRNMHNLRRAYGWS